MGTTKEETTILILAAVGIVLVLLVVVAVIYKIRGHHVYGLHEHDNVLVVRKKSVSIIPANGDGVVTGGITASQVRNQTERDRANDFRMRAKTVLTHKDSANHKAPLRLSQKKDGGSSINELATGSQEEQHDCRAVSADMSVTIQHGIDLEAGDMKQGLNDL